MTKKKILLISFVCSLLIGSLLFTMDLFAGPQNLYWGSQGPEVEKLQTKLRDWGYLKGTVNGVFGAETAQAVKEFQRKNGLKVDGVVGPNTWRALGISVATNGNKTYTPSRGVSNRDEVGLLARAIHAEAGAEPYQGKVAVGAVILNRIESPDFPNTLSGVIYQPLAFESVANGWINRSPSQDSIRAAQDAINGWDPTYGCEFFWNPSKPVSKWIWSRKIVTKIGEHVFAR